MDRYYFSGSLTQQMHDYLIAMPDFKPLDILISQLDKSAITKTIQWKREGFCRSLFIDSGAYSIHTGKAKVTVDEYIDYLNSIDDDIDVCAQLDTIPGHFGKTKNKEDYEESAKKSWENFLYMRTKLKSPNKLMPVYHQGEDFSVLANMLSWRDENGKQLDYVGISPSNDRSVKMKDIYLKEVEEFIARSDNPDVKTHLYGYTSMQGLSKYKCYSCDSISHRHISGYCKILVPEFGVISVSQKSRTSKTKSNMSFLDTADEYNKKKVEEYVKNLGFTLDEVVASSSVRVAITIHAIRDMLDDKYVYKKENVLRPKKLFSFQA